MTMTAFSTFRFSSNMVSHLLFVYLFYLISKSRAWVSVPTIRIQPNIHHRQHQVGLLLAARNSNSASSSAIRRLSVAGVSVSKEGFWVVLQVPQDGYWPVRVTSDPEDTFQTKSSEALTIIQLLNSIDTATPIFPPEVLSQLAVLHAEEHGLEEITSLIKLPDGVRSYAETNQWQRPRVRLPKVTLDELEVLNHNQFVLKCRGPDVGSLSLCPTEGMVEEVCYRYDPDTSAAFICLSLALRYNAPLVWAEESFNEDITTSGTTTLRTEEEIKELYPMYTTVDNLRQSSERVQTNIARGFEIHKLTGALRIAMERGDEAAARAIREKLDEYDSMDDLPTLGDETSDTDQMQ